MYNYENKMQWARPMSFVPDPEIFGKRKKKEDATISILRQFRAYLEEFDNE